MPKKLTKEQRARVDQKKKMAAAAATGLSKETIEAIERFKTSYNGKELIKKYDPSTTGTWQIFGEDSNADLCGPHSMPSLGYFTGRLSDVIVHAVQLPGWFTWGGGGKIERSAPPVAVKVQPVEMPKQEKISSASEIQMLQAELEEMKRTVAILKARRRNI